MPTYAIANSNRDGSSQNNTEYTLPSQHVYGSMYVAYDSGFFDAGWIWDTTTTTAIPQGATILTATVLVTRQSTDVSAGFTGNWYGYNVDSPADFTNTHTTHRTSDHEARTTANVQDDNWANTATHTSPSLVSIVQEIVNRAGFSGRIGLTYRVRTTDGGWWNYTDYTDNAANSAQLTVTWQTGSNYDIGVSVAGTSSTPNDAEIGLDRDLAVAVVGTSSTPDTAELSVGNEVSISVAVAGTSSTPDTSVLSLDIDWIVVVGGTSSTPNTVNLQAGNYAIRFRGNNLGTGSNTDRMRIELDSPADPPIDVGAGLFCYEFWILCAYADNTSTATGSDVRESNIILDRDIWGHERGWAFGVTRDGSGNLICCFGNAGASLNWTTIYGTTNVGNSQWHHIALTRNSSNQVRIWVDGVQDAQGTYSLNLSYPNGERPGSGQNNEYLVIGAEKHDADIDVYLSYNGYFDEFRVSDDTRYTTTFARPSSEFTVDGDTVALFHFSEGSGTTSADSSELSGAENATLLVGGSPSSPTWELVTLFRSIDISVAVAGTSSTPDTAVIGNAISVEVAVSGTSSTPDTVALNTDSDIAVSVAGTSSTPETSALNLDIDWPIAVAGTSATPDTVALNTEVGVVVQVSGTSSTPTDSELYFDTNLVIAVGGTSSTPDDAELIISGTISIIVAVAGTSSTPTDSELSVDSDIAVSVVGTSSTPDTVQIGVIRSVVIAVVGTSSTPDVALLAVGNSFAIAVSGTSSTPDTVGLGIDADMPIAVSGTSSTPNVSILNLDIDWPVAVAGTSLTSDDTELLLDNSISIIAQIAGLSSTPDTVALSIDFDTAVAVAGTSSTPDSVNAYLDRNIIVSMAGTSLTSSSVLNLDQDISINVVGTSSTPNANLLLTEIIGIIKMAVIGRKLSITARKYSDD